MQCPFFFNVHAPARPTPSRALLRVINIVNIIRLALRGSGGEKGEAIHAAT